MAYYVTLSPVWVEAADPAWAALLPPPHRLRVVGGAGLLVTDPGADPVRAVLAHAYYPPLAVTLSAATFQHCCDAAADPGDAARAVVTLCDHLQPAPTCQGCWARWWIRGAVAAGIPVPPRVINGRVDLGVAQTPP